jgi:hypothetical protein
MLPYFCWEPELLSQLRRPLVGHSSIHTFPWLQDHVITAALTRNRGTRHVRVCSDITRLQRNYGEWVEAVVGKSKLKPVSLERVCGQQTSLSLRVFWELALCGGLGGGGAPIVASRCVATPSRVVREVSASKDRSCGTRKQRKQRHCEPLPGNRWRFSRLRRLSTCCNELQILWNDWFSSKLTTFHQLNEPTNWLTTWTKSLSWKVNIHSSKSK